jgi:pimeloyl-ACP methyl ester carboxylesterase
MQGGRLIRWPSRPRGAVFAWYWTMAGLVFLGYPLHPANKPEQLRSAHLGQIACPMLFLQGSRDSLCRLDRLAQVLQPLTTPTHLHVIDQGDHSFQVPKRSGRTTEEVWQENCPSHPALAQADGINTASPRAIAGAPSQPVFRAVGPTCA